MNVASTTLIFRTRGTRRRPGYGLSYLSACERYEIYKSDQVAGIPSKPVRYLAIRRRPWSQVLSRHASKSLAAEACRKDLRTRTASTAPAPITRRPKP